jgi:hypothetical protein
VLDACETNRWIFQMPTNYPLASAGPREPTARPRPIPKIVKDACLLMVYGDPTDDGPPVDFVSAAKEVGMQPQTLRKYLTRPQVIAFLRAERRAFREAICSGNELALQRVRDGDQHSNPMARIAAVRTLEALETADAESHAPHRQVLPGLIVQINMPVLPPAQPVLDITPDRTAPRPLTKRE